MASNAIRMTGLSSGLDTESIISAMIQPYKNKVDYEKQNKQLLELKKESWKDMNAKIYSFYTKTLNDFKFKTTYGKTSISNSNPNVISIPEGANLPAGTHTIDVQKIAKGAMVSSSSIEISGVKATEATLLSELPIGAGDFSINVNGKTATVSVADPATMTVKQFEEAMKLQMETEGITDANFSFDANSAAFIVSSKNTGASQSIELSGTGDWTKLGIVQNAGTFNYAGADAEYTYNGGVALKSESNVIDINGLKATIIGQSAGNPVTIAAVKDVEGTIEVVQKFADEYNKLIEEINTLVDAPNARDYRPLTDEQKEAMSEGDIKLWNEKIQKSILRKDSVLSSIATEMRQVIGESALFELGVTTGDWREKGKLYINTNKLSQMIEQEPDKVDSILKDVGSKLYDNINLKLKGSKDKSSNFLFADKIVDQRITESEDKISVLEERFSRQESFYYAKFTAMEKMLSQLNSQSSWITGQLGGA